MKSPSRLHSTTTPLFLDTSAVINLIASDRIADVRKALGRPMVVEEAVFREVTRDPRDGSDGAPLMRRLSGQGVLKLASLDEAQTDTFFSLVGAPTPDDLGDGEAATIALAASNGGVVIDERKARRIIARDFPSISVFCSFDLLASNDVIAAFGIEGVRTSVKNALRIGRMRVLPEWRSFVQNLQGEPYASNARPNATAVETRILRERRSELRAASLP